MLHLIGALLLGMLVVAAFFLVFSNLEIILDGIVYLVKNVIYYGCVPFTLLILAGLAYSPDTKSTNKWDQVVNNHPQPITHIVKMQPATPAPKVDLYAEFEDAPKEPVVEVDPLAEFEQYRVTPDKQK